MNTYEAARNALRHLSDTDLRAIVKRGPNDMRTLAMVVLDERGAKYKL